MVKGGTTSYIYGKKFNGRNVSMKKGVTGYNSLNGTLFALAKFMPKARKKIIYHHLEKVKLSE